MSKHITSNQVLGEIGETAARLRFLNIGFQFDTRSRLEAGIDAIAEVMDQGRPLARMIAVQVKAKDSGKYSAEDDTGFSYLLRAEDLEYWRPSNLPVIIVLYRRSDETFFWQEVPTGFSAGERKLNFLKSRDVLNPEARDRLAALTVPKAGFGYYVPPLGGGEEAIVNILPIILPKKSYAIKVLRDGSYPVMRGTFVDLDGKGLLYTNGSIPYYGTYPGMYDPKPLLIYPHESCDSTVAQLAEEVFTLTKINWNSTQINQKLPIPIMAARKVGEILKYAKDDQQISSDYRKYI
jgi:hypothetical protein